MIRDPGRNQAPMHQAKASGDGPSRWHTGTKSQCRHASPVDQHLLRSMHLRALAATMVFSCVCLAGGAAVVTLFRAVVAAAPAATWTTALALAAAVEGAFFLRWRAKLRRLNAQPAPHHRPHHPAYDPHRSLRHFIDDQARTSQWICIRDMLSAWFAAPVERISRLNVAELITYGFFYMTLDEYEAAYGRPAEELARQLEEAWGLRLPDGYDPSLAFMAHLWQPIRCNYRPLGFYLGIEALFALKHCMMLAMGFRHTRVAGFDCYVRCDPSQVNASGAAGSEASDHVPIVFQHGVGLGLLPYALFVARLAATRRPVAALECGHLGMRWTDAQPDADEVVAGIVELVTDRLGWSTVCIAGHSYGTFYASRLLQTRPDLVHSTCLIDPVTFNMFTGKLIQNFVYTPYGSAVTGLIARDVHAAASVCRRFFWSELNLWPHHLPTRTLVVLSDADELVPVKETVRMLRSQSPEAIVLHHPTHKHAGFIKDIPWQDVVVQSLVNLLDTGVCAARGTTPTMSADAPAAKAWWTEQPTPTTVAAAPSIVAAGSSLGGAADSVGEQGSWTRRLRPRVRAAGGRAGGSVAAPHVRSDSASSYDEGVVQQGGSKAGGRPDAQLQPVAVVLP